MVHERWSSIWSNFKWAPGAFSISERTWPWELQEEQVMSDKTLGSDKVRKSRALSPPMQSVYFGFIKLKAFIKKVLLQCFNQHRRECLNWVHLLNWHDLCGFEFTFIPMSPSDSQSCLFKKKFLEIQSVYTTTVFLKSHEKAWRVQFYFIFSLPVAHSVEPSGSTPRSWVWFPQKARNDKTCTLNAM